MPAAEQFSMFALRTTVGAGPASFVLVDATPHLVMQLIVAGFPASSPRVTLAPPFAKIAVLSRGLWPVQPWPEEVYPTSVGQPKTGPKDKLTAQPCSASMEMSCPALTKLGAAVAYWSVTVP